VFLFPKEPHDLTYAIKFPDFVIF